ncbi:MAG: hypothetical protein CMB67_00105 [Euryarchaeota archaeon]|nr:hypothetical protein [Euryarchaeota archaeon]
MYDFHNVALSSSEVLLLNLAVLSIIASSLILSERSLKNQSQWPMIGLLAIFGISGRILLAPIPNVQPVTVIVLMAGAYYGATRAIALGGTIALATNVIALGHGPWTLFQAVGWGFAGIVGAHMSSRLLVNEKVRVNMMAIVAAILGFAFNWIVSLSILIDTGSSMLIPYLLNGLVFDLYHAVGNVVFVAWMAAPLGEMMARHRTTRNREAVREVATI